MNERIQSREGADLGTALTGVRVLEIGDRVGVGAAGGLLAQLGAEVIVIHPRSAPAVDKWRDPGAATCGKTVIDASASGNAALEGLARTADVLLLSSDRSMVSTPNLSAAVRESLIICDLTAFGHSGPLAGISASDALVQAVTGVAETTGARTGPPSVVGAPVLEMESAIYAATGVIAALLERRRSGRGQVVDVALYDVGVNALLAFLGLPFTGRAATRDGNRHLALAPWNAYSAADGWVQICAPTDDMWRRLCSVMGRADLVDDARFLSPSARLDNVEELDAVVANWVRSLSVRACVDLLTENVIPVSPIVDRESVASEPNLLHRGMVHRVRDTQLGQEVLLPGSPMVPRLTPELSKPDLGQPAWRTRGLYRESQPPAGQGSVGRAKLSVEDLRPLSGVRVIEVGMNTVAPLAGRHLAALGADVIKIEPPTGDSNRHNGPLREDGQSYVFAMSNTGKRGVVLDLHDPQDCAKLWSLLGTADVFIENLKPGSLQRLGFGPEGVRERFPKLIYCSINGFGHDSAYPGRPALDTVVQAMSGLMGVTVCDGVPYKAGISVSDQVGGQFGLLAVVAALARRAKAGVGCTVDLAMQDCTAWVTHPVWNQPSPAVELDRVDGAWYVSDHSGSMPVRTVAEVLAHPHTQARRLLREVPTPDADIWTVLETPFHLSRTPVPVRTAMPRLGFPEPALEAELRELPVAPDPAAPSSRYVSEANHA